MFVNVCVSVFGKIFERVTLPTCGERNFSHTGSFPPVWARMLCNRGPTCESFPGDREGHCPKQRVCEYHIRNLPHMGLLSLDDSLAGLALRSQPHFPRRLMRRRGWEERDSPTGRHCSRLYVQLMQLLIRMRLEASSLQRRQCQTD